MLDPTMIPVFALASLVVLATPGPAILFIVTRSIELGRGQGAACAFGLCLGILVHVVAATLGLSALLASSAVAYAIVKYAGAAYLIYLGIRTLLSSPALGETTVETTGVRPRKLLMQGLVINVMNPKVAIFFLAFLPPFTDASRGSVFSSKR